MAFKSAQDIRTDINTPPTESELSQRYRIAELLITEQAQYGVYTVVFTLGSQSILEFTTFMQGLGYFTRTVADNETPPTEFPIRTPGPGDTTSRIEISWQKYTVTPTISTASAGDTVSFNLTTEGVGVGKTFYWGVLTALSSADYTPNQGTMITAPNGAATQAVTLSNPLTQSGQLLFKLYSDAGRTRQIAEATAVAVLA
jgi:hypothetical protein